MNLSAAAATPVLLHTATPSPHACLTSQDSTSPLKYPQSGWGRDLLTFK